LAPLNPLKTSVVSRIYMSVEPIVALRWMLDILRGDATLAAGVTGGWARVAAAGVLSPFGIIRQMTGAADLYGLDGAGEVDGWRGEPLYVPLIMQTNLYDREQGDLLRIDPLADRVHYLLQRQQGEIPFTGLVYTCRRVRIKAGENVLGQYVEQYIEQQWELHVKSL
jgi:hypothetical protein